MENKSSATRSKVIVMLLVVSLIANVGLFFYGLINNISMKAERGISLELQTRIEECQSETIQAKQKLESALEVARRAKDFALEQSMLAAKEASKNK